MHSNESINSLIIPGFSKYDNQAGSNIGGYYIKWATSEQYYIKSPSQADSRRNEDIVKNEHLAGKLYELAGIKVPELSIVEDSNGDVALASKIILGYTPFYKKHFRCFKVSECYEGFATDAWLANWDVVGLEYDNIGTYYTRNANTGTYSSEVVRIDLGGALLYRAQGDSKDEIFSNEVKEIEIMAGKANITTPASYLFHELSEYKITQGVKKIAAIANQKIIDIVLEFGPGSIKDREKLANTLIARKKYLIDKYKVDASDLNEEQVCKLYLDDPEKYIPETVNIYHVELRSGSLQKIIESRALKNRETLTKEGVLPKAPLKGKFTDENTNIYFSYDGYFDEEISKDWVALKVDPREVYIYRDALRTLGDLIGYKATYVSLADYIASQALKEDIDKNLVDGYLSNLSKIRNNVTIDIDKLRQEDFCYEHSNGTEIIKFDDGASYHRFCAKIDKDIHLKDLFKTMEIPKVENDVYEVIVPQSQILVDDLLAYYYNKTVIINSHASIYNISNEVNQVKVYSDDSGLSFYDPFNFYQLKNNTERIKLDSFDEKYSSYAISSTEYIEENISLANIINLSLKNAEILGALTKVFEGNNANNKFHLPYAYSHVYGGGGSDIFILDSNVVTNIIFNFNPHECKIAVEEKLYPTKESILSSLIYKTKMTILPLYNKFKGVALLLDIEEGDLTESNFIIYDETKIDSIFDLE